MTAPTDIDARYRREQTLGRGGMGEVYLARDTHLDRWVAIKKLRRDKTVNPRRRERIRREAQLAAQISHPAVVRIYDVIIDDVNDNDDRDQAAGDTIIMEYVAGRNLQECLMRGRPSLAEKTLPLAWQIAGGMAAAHEHEIIHRDLKAANILVTEAGNAKITDFGIAKTPDSDTLTREGGVVGTVMAMSPEQVRQKPLDTRSDLFSFGILLYQMVTGRPPFWGPSESEIYEQIVHAPPPDIATLAPDTPEPLKLLIAHLLQKSRDLRPRGGFPEVQQSIADIAKGIPGCTERLRYHSDPAFQPSGENTQDPAVVGTGTVEPLRTGTRTMTGQVPGTLLPPDHPPLPESSGLSGSGPSISGPPMSSSSGPSSDTPDARSVDAPSEQPVHVESSDIGLDTTSRHSRGQTSESPSGKSRLPWTWVSAGMAALALVLAVPNIDTIERAISRVIGVFSPELPLDTSPDPMRVAVPEPILEDAENTHWFVKHATRNSVVRTIYAMDNVAVVDTTEIDNIEPALSTLSQLRKAVAAQEVLRIRLRCTFDWCDATLIRLDHRDAEVARESIHIELSDLKNSDAALAIATQALYGDKDKRLNRPGLPAISREQYERFVRLRRTYRHHASSIADNLASLETLADMQRELPEFVELYHLRAEIHRHLVGRDTSIAHLSAAEAIIEQGLALQPESERLRGILFDVQLEQNQLDRARTTLAFLQRHNPGSAITKIRHAKILFQDGKSDQALQILEAALDRHPSWIIAYHLAELELHSGLLDRARQRLDAIVQYLPNQYTILALLGRVESTAGNFERAVGLYRELKKHRHSEDVDEALSVALLLTGQCSAAEEMLSDIYAKTPTAPAALNLAEIHKIQGNAEQAAALFGKALNLMSQLGDEAETRLWQMMRAYALAHLGNSKKAGDIVRQVRGSEDFINGDEHYYAAVIYILADDREAATHHAKFAQQLGYNDKWFRMPWFLPLRPALGLASTAEFPVCQSGHTGN